MSEVDHYEAGRLEQYLVPPDRWRECPFADAVEIAESASADGIPAGLACDPATGKWYVLMSGQGPYIAWDQDHPWKWEKEKPLPCENGFCQFTMPELSTGEEE